MTLAMVIGPPSAFTAQNDSHSLQNFRIRHSNNKNESILCVGLMDREASVESPTRISAFKTSQNRNRELQGENESIGVGTNVRTLCRQGRLKEALNILHAMDQQSIRPDSDTYGSLLEACSSMEAVAEGKQVHAHMLQSEIELNVFLQTKLVIMYVKCGDLASARQVFDKMAERSLFSWTAMIAGHAKHGYCQEALILACRMQQTGIGLDNFIFPSVLKACARLGALTKGKEIHAYIIKGDFERDVVVESAIVDMYAKCRCVIYARHVFDKMSHRNGVSWSAMIAGYTHNGLCDEALKLFKQMQFTGLKPNVMSWNAIIAGCSQSGWGDEALKLFSQMHRASVKPDSFTLGSVLAACASLGDLKQGMVIHGYIIRCGFHSVVFLGSAVSVVFLGSALTDMYCKCGIIEDARQVFDKISQRNVFAWTAMIAGLAHSGLGYESLKLFRKMQDEGMEPNSVTVASVLPACAYLAALEHGKEIHAFIIRRGFESDVFAGSALLDMYAKCGGIEDACHVFDNIFHRDLGLWNTMIAGYAMHGRGEDALMLFYHMQLADIKPNDITFVGVLSACSHAGLVDEGWHYFDLMSRGYSITPTLEHYACMVDLLGRAGHLYDAYDFINKMPLEPDAFVWSALLSACRIHRNIELGECVARHLFELKPENAGSYILLSNIYAAAGRWDDATNVRKLMKDRGIIKRPGCSWIKVKNKVHAFLVGDTSHPQTEEIYARLESLTQQMEEVGFVPDPDFVLHDVIEEDKEHILHRHSEKLAIAFGLISTCSGTPIRIIKNLRVCGDCHTAIKFISKIVGREIFVRDASRFHYFKDGLCSCGDYW